MKKIILLISLVFLCVSCFFQRGYWANDACRPKNSNFKLLKTPFKETDKLVFNRIYAGINNAGWGFPGFGFGFYPDGRMIKMFSDNENITYEDVNHVNWNNAKFIGYWRVENEKIKVQYFLCGNSGVYIDQQGEIKGDTIIFYQNFVGVGLNPFKKEVREERYILSDMTFNR